MRDFSNGLGFKSDGQGRAGILSRKAGEGPGFPGLTAISQSNSGASALTNDGTRFDIAEKGLLGIHTDCGYFDVRCSTLTHLPIANKTLPLPTYKQKVWGHKSKRYGGIKAKGMGAYKQKVWGHTSKRYGKLSMDSFTHAVIPGRIGQCRKHLPQEAGFHAS